MSNIALILAGGIGARMHQDIPKQFINVYDKPVIIYTMEAFQNHPNIDAIEIVCLDGWHDILRAYAKQFGISKLENVVSGGTCGQISIRNGLEDIVLRHTAPDDIVLIHDAIRPMVSTEIISDCIRVAMKYGNAITAIPCAFERSSPKSDESVLLPNRHPQSKSASINDEINIFFIIFSLSFLINFR